MDQFKMGENGIPYRWDPKTETWLPHVELPENMKRPLEGKYERMRLEFMKEHLKVQYVGMMIDETLWPHLEAVQRITKERVDQVMKELLAKNPAPDRNTHNLEWANHMMNIQAEAEAIVLPETVYAMK